jgi:two-component sensor histidine kinase
MESGRVPARPLSYEGVWRFTTPAVDVSVPAARHAVRDLLRRQAVPAGRDLLQSLLLIVSELVTNAVKHAAVLSPEVAVEVAVTTGWVRVSVEDSHPGRPKVLEAEMLEADVGEAGVLEADRARPGGRGLLLVREITREAGGAFDVEHTAGGGKIVWAALPLTPPLGGPAAAAGGVTSPRRTP